MKCYQTIELTLEGATEPWVAEPLEDDPVFGGCVFFKTLSLGLLVSFRSSNMYFTMLILCLVISLPLFPEEGSL